MAASAAHSPSSAPRTGSLLGALLGADFGGNARLVGASPNVVVAGMSESRGHPISFGRFLRYGVPATLLTMLGATVDVIIRTALA